MGKYDHLKYWGSVKARTVHYCRKCGATINKGQFYYSEKLGDKFLHIINPKKLCQRCYEQEHP